MSLSDVLRDPWPDAPRRAFLLSAPPDRAEFTRLGLDLARLLRARADHSRWSPVEMQMFVVGAKRMSWVEPLTKLVGTRVRWGRGFVEGIETDAGFFLDRASDIYALSPVLDLALSNVQGHAETLFDSPFFARIRSLRFTTPVDDRVLSALADSPFAGNLRWLDLDGHRVTEAGLSALAGSSGLGKLAWVGGGNGAADVNPEFVEDEGGVYDSRPNPLAERLVARCGRRAWLAGWDHPERPRPDAFE